ncbi:MAG: winged helix-turn-helix domain-containing tetratricopeptide repeat protein [Gammaproteobacteria bacterium]|nr:winged helix-turn-helix domain-containing tetratricopeptide repeat protein [Gammaproteobacteria bacterium]
MNTDRPFQIGNVLVDPANGRVLSDGKEHKIEPRMMDVLVYLASRAGNVVSREVLEQEVWNGRVVSYDALTGTMRKLRKILQDDARNPRIIETIPKKGYRLLASVIEPADSDKRLAPFNKQMHRERHSYGLLLIVFISILALTFTFNFNHMTKEVAQPAAEPYTIAVLPFNNLGGDAAQEYFADGMTDDLITELAKNPDLFVIARDSTFLYKNNAVDVRQIARELGVRFILSGSVRQAGDRLRLNVQLINAEDGGIVWADSFNGKLKKVFSLQDKITDNILTSLAIGMHAPASLLGSDDRPVSIEAYDYFLHGRNRFFRYASKQDNQKARELYEKAIELDNDYSMAYAMLAWTYAFDAMNGWSDNRKVSLEQALVYARKALARNEALPVAYFVTGLVYREFGQYEQARQEAEKALVYDSNYANAYVLLATLLYYTGHAEEGLEKIKMAMRLNPHHPYNYPFHLGQAYFILERYDEAIAAFEQGLDSNPSSERMHVWLAAAYVKANRPGDAKWEADQVLAINPDFDIEKIRQAFPFSDAKDLERFLSAIRQAGLGGQL